MRLVEIRIFLEELSQRNIFVSLKEGKLKLHSKEPLDSETLAKLKSFKENIIEFLSLENQNIYDLSFAQSRLWFLDQYEAKSSTTYNESALFSIKGELNIQAFEQSFQEVIARQDGLRTNFVEILGEPIQMIHEDIDFTLEPQKIDTIQMEAIIEQELQRSFDLTQDRLFNALLFQLASDDYKLFINIHHIIADGWSVAVMVSELGAIYKALVSNSPNPLKPLEIQYGDFAQWQLERLNQERLDSKMEYWRNQLQGIETLELPTDYHRPPHQTFAGQTIAFSLDQSMKSALEAINKTYDVTMFMTLLSAFSVLLHKYSNQSDISIGSPIANRTTHQIEPLIGMFVNTLVLRSDIDDNLSFNTLLANTKQTTLDAYEHQDVPFEKIVDALGVERDTSRSPLFQVMFILQNNDTIKLELEGLDVSFVELERGIAKFDITLSITEELSGAFSCALEYNSDLFKPSTMERMIGHFQALLSAIIANPNEKISNLNLLTSQEQEQFNRWNQTEAQYPKEATLHQLLEAQVAKTPNKIAVVFEDQTLSYQELNAKANQVAHYLLEQGIKADSLVAIQIERSLEMMIGLLGILKAGGAYVPIDPSYPKDRIAYMIEDSNAKVHLTKELITKALMSNYPNTNPLIAMSSHNLAYVIYTSGSTGKPKGVMIEHTTLINFLDSMSQKPKLSSNDRLLALTAISFDIHTLELYLPLIKGATLIVASFEQTKDPTLLAKAIQSNQTTMIQATPATFKMLLSNNWQPTQTLKLLCGGEAIPQSLKDQLLSFDGITLWNMYGPTETTVWSTIKELKIDEAICIGKPIHNTTLHILDENLNQVPIGVSGELHIGGAGLARGYLHREDLTLEKFINHPHFGRVYKTGDLVKQLESGDIEYIARADDQIKLRGFRIELGEIENVLAKQKGIHEAVVLLKEANSNKNLIAYVVPSHEAVTLNAIKEELKKELPEFMIPSALINLKSLPLTPNGKVDKKALLKLDVTIESTKEYIAPRDEVETQLSAIFQEVLNLQEPVGIMENFFELGGHSLLATQLISKIRQSFEVDIALKMLFQEPTIEKLSRIIQESSQDATLQELIITLRDKSIAKLPLSYTQERLWFLNQYEENQTNYNIPALLKLEGELNRELLEKSFQTIIERHEILRTHFVEGVQIVDQEADFRLEYSVIANESALQKSIEHQLTQAFELGSDLLLRATLYELEPKHYRLFVTMHHIISDGWSLSLLVNELIALYKAYLNEESNPLKPLDIQYADYALWQREYLSGEVLEHKIAYWKDALEGIETLELPTDYPRPLHQSYQGQTLHFTIDQSLTHSLEAINTRYDVTMFMTLLSAFSLLLHRYSNQNDIAIGSPIANRTNHQIEPLIGMFVNTLVLRNQMEGDTTFTTLLSSSKERTLSAYEHQDVPFEKIVDALGVERDTSRSPLFQVMFILQNNPAASFELPNVTASLEALETHTAKFDMTLDIEQIDNHLKCALEYNTDLFKPSTMERLIHHFQTLLRAIIANPNEKINDLNILTQAEEKQFNLWNQTKIEYPKEATLHQLFEAQVSKTPNAIAVVFEKQSLSYEELNAKANQIAHYLIEQGIKPDTLVAIQIERSLEMMIGLLGILKAGGAYVPIDPTYPEDRIEYMIEDSNAKVLVNKAVIDEVLESDYSSTNPLVHMHSNHLAYVIYTSGSTGKPKGVMVEHQGVVNRIAWMQKEYQLDTNDIILQKTPFSFDVSVWELFLPLMYGIKLVFAKPEGHKDNAYLTKLIQKESITFLHFVPSMLSNMIHSEGFSECDSIKNIVCSGEALPHSLAKTFYEKVNHITLHNLYGPTEASIDVTSYLCPKQSSLHTVPIGKAIDNTTLYILDENLNQVPVGVIGELHIGGVGLARGYLNKAELTQEKFIHHPQFGRLYKTGDLVRYLDDGNIEYLSRMDDQIKLRGFRIELGEIESVIANQESIQEVVVLLKNDNLIAYVVPSGEAIVLNDMKEELQKELPEFMIPSALINLEALPLTPNGKVDRKALLKLDVRVESNKEYVAPRDEREAKLASIFKEVLGLNESYQVSIHDSFFELGGHSLSAITLISHINKHFDVELELKALFANPKIDAIAKLIEQSQTKSYQPIPPIDVQEHYPLSNAQRRLWVLDKMQEGFNAYNIPAAISFDEAIDESILQASFEYLIQRHEILRTHFIECNGEIRQMLDEKSKACFEAISIEKDSIDAYLEKEAKRIFDLENDSLIKVKLINRTLLFVNMHHIISDGWSIEVMMRELSAIYNALRSQQPIQLKTLSIQYRDYTHWQNTLLEDENYLKAHQSYWHDLLNGYKRLDFPLDFPRGSSQSFDGESKEYIWDQSIMDKLKNLSQESTLFITLLTLTNTLLSKYTNQEDIVIGSPVANRVHPDLLDQIGFYVNTLPLRNQLNHDQSFKENLLAIKQNTLRAFEHQSYPFDKLVDELNLDRDVSQNPLFNIMLVLQNQEETQLHFGETTSHTKRIETKSSKFDITFTFTQIGDSLHLHFEYNPKLFKVSTIERIAANFKELIVSLQSDQLLRDINILSQAEESVIESFNQTYTPYPKDKTFIELFETQVLKTPDATAVICEDRALSYHELNQKANALGAYLRDNYTIHPDTIVPILLSRSEWMIVAILGILKSSGAYLPIDPEYPDDRIEFMLSDSKASLLLCDPNTAQQAKGYGSDLGIEVIDIQALNYTQAVGNLEIKHASNNLAYIIYTSGSTGRPKGVMVEHSNLSSFVYWGLDEFRHDDFDIMYFVTSNCFDISIFEIFFTLLRAKTIKVLDSGLSILDHLQKDKNIFINTVPSVVKLLLSQNADFSNVNSVNMAGEPIAQSIIERLTEYPNLAIRNLYGPTEATVYATSYHFEANTKVLIGKALSSNKLYILDAQNRRVPLGALGELHIAGDGLTRGYLNREELTHEKFIHHPQFGRLYKTGDICRYLEDGNIDYLGRADDQVKIRGFRIELGEIESSIGKQQGVKEVVVIAKPLDESLDKVLTAYLVLHDGANQEQSFIKALQKALKEHLPNYMIPSYFVILEQFPLMPNGKIDKKALPNPLQITSNREITEPTTQSEQIIIDAFKAILKHEHISTEDNFFDIGGDSIKAIQIASNIAQKGYKITIESIFKADSIKELAHHLTIPKEAQQISQESMVGVIPLTPIQEWFFTLKNPLNHFNQAVMVKANEPLNEALLIKTLQQIQTHHDMLRVNFKFTDKHGVEQIAHKAANYPLDFQLIECNNLEEIKKHANAVQSSLEIAYKPLMKVVLFRIEGEQDRLLIVIHHLVIDGISWRVLLEDIQNLYQAYQSDIKITLPLKTASFREYAHTLQTYAQNIEEQREYWQNCVAQEHPLPSDHPIQERWIKNRNETVLKLSKEVTRSLIEESHSAYNTQINDLLLTALSRALYASFGTTQNLISMEGHGREEILGIDISRTVGWFTTLYPLLLRYEERVEYQIKQVKESIRAIPDKGLGYGVLRYISRAEELTYQPQISFNYLGVFENHSSESLFEATQESTGKMLSDTSLSPYKLDINAVVLGGEFSLTIAYDRLEYEQEHIESFRDQLKTSLLDIIEHCSSQEGKSITPSDITDEDFDIDLLDALMEDFNKGELE